MEMFAGIRMKDNTCRVYWIDERGCHPLGTYWDECRHSPCGFNWGYGGSGPAQLAYALLRKATGCKEAAQRLYQQYKWQVVAAFKRPYWSLTRHEVYGWITAHLTHLDTELAERVAVVMEGSVNE